MTSVCRAHGVQEHRHNAAFAAAGRGLPFGNGGLRNERNNLNRREVG